MDKILGSFSIKRARYGHGAWGDSELHAAEQALSLPADDGARRRRSFLKQRYECEPSQRPGPTADVVGGLTLTTPEAAFCRGPTRTAGVYRARREAFYSKATETVADDAGQTDPRHSFCRLCSRAGGPGLRPVNCDVISFKTTGPFRRPIRTCWPSTGSGAAASRCL